jgi:hypothetical protein
MRNGYGAKMLIFLSYVSMAAWAAPSRPTFSFECAGFDSRNKIQPTPSGLTVSSLGSVIVEFSAAASEYDPQTVCGFVRNLISSRHRRNPSNVCASTFESNIFN